MLSRWLVPMTACFTLVCVASAKESVCFKTGFCMEADSHTEHDGIVQFQTRGGTMEFPADQISEILQLKDSPPPIVASPNSVPLQTEELVIRAAIEQGLEPDFVRSVARVESGLRQEAVSPKGALGVMQLMPSTAAGLGVDPKLAEGNALGGAKFLRELLIRYHGDAALALAAYNAGPGAVAKFGGVPPYAETRRYIIKVLREYERQQRQQAKAAAAASKPSATN